MRAGLDRLAAWLVAVALSMPAVACRTEAVASADDLLKAPFEALPSQVKRALVVGATRYQDPLAPLEFTDQDAQEFARLLKELWHFPEENVIRMTDGEAIPNLQPTGNNLFTQIQRMKETVKPESVLVFFFSGHGVRAEDKDWLIPVDGNLANPARTCSSATELRDTLETVRPHRALLIIDACRNRLETDKGVGVSGGAGQDTRQPKHPQLAVMYACEATEKSWEAREFKHGVFTHFLLKGLRGDPRAAEPSGIVTVISLQEYVRANVQQYVEVRFGANQHPKGFTGDWNMALTRSFEPPANDNTRIARAETEALIIAAYAYLDDDRYGDAVAAANAALEKSPENADARCVLGSVYLKQKQYDPAIRELNEALRLNQNLYPARVRLDRAQQAKGAGASGLSREAGKRVVARSLLETAFYLSGQEPVDTTIERLVRDALERLRDGQFAAAESRANEAIARDGGNAQAHQVLGRVYAARGRYDEAIREYQEALRVEPGLTAAREGLQLVLQQKGPQDAWRLANAASLLVEQGRFGPAEIKAREAIARAPDIAEAHFALGRVYHNQKRYEDAIHEFGDALRLDPDLAGVQPALAAAQRGQSDNAALLLAQEAHDLIVAERFAEAAAKAGAALKQNPANGLARFVLGRVAHRAQEYPIAIREYQEALRLEPGLEEAREFLRRVVGEMPPRDAAALVTEALQLAEKGRLDEAEIKAREGIARAPGNAAGHFVLARLFSGRARYDEAIGEYTQAQRLDANHAGARSGLQEAVALQGKQEAALLAEEAHQHLIRVEFLAARDKARHALALDAGNAKAHAALGNALLWLDSVESGQQEVERALLLAPRLPLAHAGRGTSYWLAGRPFWLQAYGLRIEQNRNPRGAKKLEEEMRKLLGRAMKEFGRAEQEFQEALKADPKDILARNNLGAVYQMMNQPDKAVKEYQRVLALDDYHVTYYNLGNVYLDRRHWSEAENAYREAIRRYPRNAGSHAQLGMALLQQGKIEEAKRAAREARDRGLTDHYLFEELNKRGITL